MGQILPVAKCNRHICLTLYHKLLTVKKMNGKRFVETKKQKQKQTQSYMENILTWDLITSREDHILCWHCYKIWCNPNHCLFIMCWPQDRFPLRYDQRISSFLHIANKPWHCYLIQVPLSLVHSIPVQEGLFIMSKPVIYGSLADSIQNVGQKIDAAMRS